MKGKKGFTLVELLAVIVILAIILAIAVPGISGIISSAKRGAFESDAKMIATGIEYAILESTVNTTVTTPVASATPIANVSSYGADPSNYTNVYIVDLDPITICVETAANSEFGTFAATATKATVKYLDTYGTPYEDCAAYIADNPIG